MEDYYEYKLQYTNANYSHSRRQYTLHVSIQSHFTLDGRLDNEFWADIPFTDLFVDIEGSSRPTPRFATRAKIAWDHENLYFGAILEGNEIWGNITERDAVIFYDNDFEIFIDPDSDTSSIMNLR